VNVPGVRRADCWRREEIGDPGAREQFKRGGRPTSSSWLRAQREPARGSMGVRARDPTRRGARKLLPVSLGEHGTEGGGAVPDVYGNLLNRSARRSPPQVNKAGATTRARSLPTSGPTRRAEPKTSGSRSSMCEVVGRCGGDCACTSSRAGRRSRSLEGEGPLRVRWQRARSIRWGGFAGRETLGAGFGRVRDVPGVFSGPPTDRGSPAGRRAARA